jgi:outer membrane protein OmpA-like peptidoglycan-associated protein
MHPMRSMCSRPIALALLAAAASTLAATSSSAQTASGFSLDRFNPSERGSEWFALDSLDLRGHLRPAIGVVGELADSPLVLYNADGSVRSKPVQYQLVLHPGASLVLWDRLRVGFDLPIAVYESGNGGAVDGVTYQGVGSAGIGDLRLGADVRLLGQYGDVFRLAAGAQVFVPVGSQSGYLSDGSIRIVIPRVQVAGDVDWFSYAANVGFNYRNDTSTFGGTPLGSEFVFGASAGAHLFDRKLLFGPEIYGSTVVTNGSAFAKTNTPLELLIGGHYLIADSWRVGLGVAPGLTRGLGEPAVRYLASVEWAPQPPPPPPADRDHDGILDDEDACPDEPGVKTDDPKTNGCPPPPPPPPSDRDKDGIIDSEDACPDVPGVKTDDPKTNGCPPDRDHDGILDSDDACPDVPGVKTDDPKTNGCPPDPDRDKDGIPNDQDACPDTPGPHNDDPKKNGCPQAAVVGKQIVILDQVKFATGSAKILPASDGILNAVLTVLTGHPEITHVSVEGHTDNVGAAAMNKSLSGRRAASVVDWLVKHGIDKARLSSVGFGMERPIDSNDTPEGRQNNRRVEFHIEDGGAKPKNKP